MFYFNNNTWLRNKTLCVSLSKIQTSVCEGDAAMLIITLDISTQDLSQHHHASKLIGNYCVWKMPDSLTLFESIFKSKIASFCVRKLVIAPNILTQHQAESST
jgi:hypothetical protein